MNSKKKQQVILPFTYLNQAYNNPPKIFLLQYMLIRIVFYLSWANSTHIMLIDKRIRSLTANRRSIFALLQGPYRPGKTWKNAPFCRTIFMWRRLRSGGTFFITYAFKIFFDSVKTYEKTILAKFSSFTYKSFIKTAQKTSF